LPFCFNLAEKKGKKMVDFEQALTKTSPFTGRLLAVHWLAPVWSRFGDAPNRFVPVPDHWGTFPNRWGHVYNGLERFPEWFG
jgi:hypothetical protein